MELAHLVLEQFYFNELFHFFQVIRFSSVVEGSEHLFWLLGRGMYVCVWCVSCSVMSDSLRPHGLYPDKLLCSWTSPGKNTGVSSHSLLQRIFLTQG